MPKNRLVVGLEKIPFMESLLNLDVFSILSQKQILPRSQKY